MRGEKVEDKGFEYRGSDPELMPAAISDIGCERELNEDRYAVIETPIGRAWIVCDGMGGVSGGDLAAQLAIDTIRRALVSQNFANPASAINSAIEEANRIIVLRRQNQAFKNMGTTVVSVMIKGSQIILCHAGDSRAYIVSDEKIEQLTVDHTYVQDLVERGAISREEAMSHPQAHVLTRCVGSEPRLRIDTKELWIGKTGKVNEKILLCSDGLYSLVEDSEIQSIVTSKSSQESCVELVELAKKRGGYDNITVAVIPISGTIQNEQPEGELADLLERSAKAATEVRPLNMPLSLKLSIAGALLLLGVFVGLLLFLLKMLGS